MWAAAARGQRARFLTRSVPNMAYRVDLSERAVRDLRRIYVTIHAADLQEARDWFDRLEHAVFSLAEHPSRGARIPEDSSLRHLLYGRKRHRYRIIYAIDETSRVVTVLHIRHGARAPLNPADPDDEA
jgi:plasmid stabilization system protein ParE